MAIELTLHTINNEPRILDTDLAERLGMKNPRKIRQNLIEANLSELQGYGEIRMELIRNGQRGRPATAYYLNEEQALLICMFSKTENAQLVRELTPLDILSQGKREAPLR